MSSQHESYRRLSYQTISAVGPNAAMAHYTPTNETDRQITRTEIYLIDSGTQYKGKYHVNYVRSGSFSMFNINHRIYFRSFHITFDLYINRWNDKYDTYGTLWHTIRRRKRCIHSCAQRFYSGGQKYFSARSAGKYDLKTRKNSFAFIFPRLNLYFKLMAAINMSYKQTNVQSNNIYLFICLSIRPFVLLCFLC